jgi:very-short-patch-repair endonuclease
MSEPTSPPSEGSGEVPGYVTVNPFTYRFIKEMSDRLKNNPTPAEKVLWEYLRNKKTGHKIRRQHIIDDFITDFVCLSKRLVIEIDGKIHARQKEYDALRNARLNQLGYEVVRFKNEAVLAAPQNVADKIKMILDSRLSYHEETADVASEIPVTNPEDFAPIDLLDYIYAVLHSPTYREKYKEFLKIDFPRVPYPENADTFWKLVQLGSELRQLHLLESPVVEQFITTYPASGDNKVSKVRYECGKVWINATQYFAGVPEIAWGFYIGGYQPAQKWLKDRKDRELSFEDIRHYQKIVIALTETDRIMKEIDGVVMF